MRLISEYLIKKETMNIKTFDIKKLREITSCSVMDCKSALENAKGDFKKAERFLIKQGALKLEHKKDRETNSGLIGSYNHNGKIGVMVEVQCETDFVAKNELFKDLVKDLAMQVAAMNPKDVSELIKQNFIKDESKTIKEIVDFAISKLGENIQVKRFERMELGK